MKPGGIGRDAQGRLQVAPSRTLRVCPEGCDYTSPAQAVSAAYDGDTIRLEAGIYTTPIVISQSHITLSGAPGTHIREALAEGKGAILVKGNDTVIEGIECSEIASHDQNGSCIRMEGRNLTVRHVYFHDSEEGILTGSGTGDVLIEDSKFERLGAGGRAHGIYAGALDSLVIRRSFFLASRDEGHEIKSRAAKTVVEDSVVASLDGVDSRLLDICNGGEAVIRNTVLEKGPEAANYDLIGYGIEGLKYPNNTLTLENVQVILDHPRAHFYNGSIKPSLRGVEIIGPAASAEAGSGARIVASRADAKLPPYPALPSPADISLRTATGK